MDGECCRGSWVTISAQTTTAGQDILFKMLLKLVLKTALLIEQFMRKFSNKNCSDAVCRFVADFAVLQSLSTGLGFIG